MAVMLQRLGLAALAVAALVLPAVKPEGPAPRSVSEERGQRLRQLQLSLGRVNYRLSALTERDSALRLSRGVLPGSAPRIILRGFPAGARSPVAEAMVGSLWKSLGEADSSVSVALVIYNGAGYSQRFGSYQGTSIRSIDRTVQCIGLLAGELRPDGGVRVWNDETARVLSPCALVSGFGPPGKGVLPWLVATRFGRAASAGWLTRPKVFLEGNGGAPWRPGTDFSGDWDGSSILRLRSLASMVQNIVPAYHLGGVALRCLNEAAIACAEGVLDTTRFGPVQAELPGDLTVSPWRLGVGSDFLGPVPVAEYWVSDVIRDQGREKFRQFWRSDLPMTQAFQASFGESLADWTARWARRQWEGSWEVKYRKPTLTLGASLSPSWPLLIAGWSGLILLAASWTATRRQSR